MLKVFEITKNAEPLTLLETLELQEEVRQTIREYMSQGIFKNPTGRLRDSIRSYVVDNEVHIASHEEYASAQNDGVQSHVMWYLLGETVPIRLKTGQTIYRKATLKSFLNGSWRHPGYSGKQFVEEGMRRMQMKHPDVQIRKTGDS